MDQQKAERLIALHADAVYRMAYIKTGKREDAEDITQETFLRMLRCGKTFRDEEHRRAWLLRVANNYAVDLLRAPWHKRCSSLEEVQAAAQVISCLWRRKEKTFIWILPLTGARDCVISHIIIPMQKLMCRPWPSRCAFTVQMPMNSTRKRRCTFR